MPELDARLFRPEAIAPEVAALNERVEKAMAGMRPVYEVGAAETRAAREAGGGLWGPIQTVDAAEARVIPGPAGELGLRVLVPDVVRAVYLHLHGGGWVLGAAHHADVRNWEMARHCGVAVVSVDYRLAPEAPYPAGPDDCEAAALWLAEHARAEFGSDRLLIGGESAGAHLSAVTLLRMRDRHGFTGFAAANLVFGMYDLGFTPSVRRWGERNLILNTPLIEWFTASFVGDADSGDPDVSPLRADLRGLPPALFSVGTLDPLLDDSLFMHARWRAAGSDAELAAYPGGIHGFTLFPIPLARQANEHAEAFLRAALE